LVVAEEKEMAGTEETGGEEPMAAPEVEATEVQQAAASEAQGAVEETAADEASPVAEEESAVEEPVAASLSEEVEDAAVAVDEPVGDELPEPAARVPTLDELGARTDVYYYGTGRRKTSSAQVRLYPSKEPDIVVNDKPVDEYFSRPVDVSLLRKPLQVTATEGMFRISVKVKGGGITGQAGAVRHGIARALTQANPDFRPVLRREGSLTRDPRMKERKKPGLKRARKAPQYTKR
jgi:small subunit ribosomal protein S9